jgi:MFS family permease
MTSLDHRNDVSHEEAAAPGEVRRWRAFSLLAVAFLMTIVDLTIVNVALPTIGRKLHFPPSDLQWVVTAYALTFGGFLLLGGRAADLLGRRRLFMAGLAIFAFITVSIGALAGVTDHDAGVASGLLNTSQQIGGAIGVAVASTVAAAHSRLLLRQGHAAAAALTGGFHWAFWVTGLTALAAVPVTFLLIRRTELARAVAASLQREVPVPAPAD